MGGEVSIIAIRQVWYVWQVCDKRRLGHLMAFAGCNAWVYSVHPFLRYHGECSLIGISQEYEVCHALESLRHWT
jgi:hypothetical protein